jgi:anthranilate phosphoribosyltransferase
MEYLGYSFTNDQDKLKKQIDRSGICFLHAPLFHPAMKEVAPIRKNIGVQTFFNMLGPMVNPSFPKKQLVGVFSLQLLRYYKYIYERENGSSYRIVHSLDGYDEISLTGSAKIVSPEGEYLLHADDLIPEKLYPSAIQGGVDVATSADIFLKVLQGQGSAAQNAVVAANAALAIQCYKQEAALTDCYAEAIESLQSGMALQSFKTLVTS